MKTRYFKDALLKAEPNYLYDVISSRERVGKGIFRNGEPLQGYTLEEYLGKDGRFREIPMSEVVLIS